MYLGLSMLGTCNPAVKGIWHAQWLAKPLGLSAKVPPGPRVPKTCAGDAPPWVDPRYPPPAHELGQPRNGLEHSHWFVNSHDDLASF